MAAEARAIEADIPMGMTQIGEGDAKVLLVRDANGLRAFQATCPHYGAPLAKGEICGHTLYCPWHKAAFDIGDGALVAPPALNALAQYPIRTEGESIVVTLEPMAAAKPSARADSRTFVIVGTGAAAVAAVTTLRDEGFGGKIVAIAREAGEPYDRPKLSKNFLAKPTPTSAVVLDKNFFADHGVEVRMGPAKRIDPETRTVTLANGTEIVGDALLIATGSKAVVPPFAGRELSNIFTLRSLDDAVALSAAAQPGAKIAVIGGGFIGLEAAAFLTKRGLSATVVSPEPLPLATRFGDDVAAAIKIHHEGTGVRFVHGKVAKFEGEISVSGVRLEGGEVLDTDLVLIGAGAAPEVDVVDAPKHASGGLEVDAMLKLAPGVWVAGDIAAFPEAHSGTVARIEHWRLAQQHGRHAARAMMGHEAPFREAPFFWSNQGDKRLDYAGYAPDWERIEIKGETAKLDFIAYYIRGGKALAACAIGHNPEMIRYLDMLANDGPPTAEMLA